MRNLQFFFGTSQVSRTQSAIGAELMMEVYKEVVAAAVQKVRREETLAPVPFNVREMSMEGLAKVRYVGAWAIRKVLNKEIKYVRVNMLSTNATTQESVSQCHQR